MRTIILFATLTAGMASASLTAVPGGLANTSGNSNAISPLSVGSYFLNGGAQGAGQMQQLYDASYFTSLGSSIDISQVAFRNPPSDSPYANSPLLADVMVYMATSSLTADNLSSTFASNENSPVLVYSGPLQFNLAYDNGNPRCFCYTIPFTSDYVYNPANGSLLLDIVVVQGNDPGNSTLPALDFQSGGIGMAVAVNYTSSSSLTAATELDSGWATQFTYDVGTETPEPAGIGLAALGVILLALRRRGN